MEIHPYKEVLWCYLPFLCILFCSTTVSNVHGHMTCPDGWILYRKDRTCLMVGPESKVFRQASIYCQVLKGDLVKIKDAEKNGFITDQYLTKPYESYLIGLRRITDGNQDPTKYAWLGETEQADYTNWSMNEPDLSYDTNCVTIISTKGEWRSYWCDSPKKFICEMEAIETVPLNAICDTGWENSPDDNHCYKFDLESRTWHNANQLCALDGGNLMSIPSSYEMIYILGLLLNRKKGVYWTGGNSIDQQNGWTWNDNQPFAFVIWAPGEPNSNASAACLALDDYKGDWTSDSCMSLKPSICKKRAKDHVTKPVPIVLSTTIPIGMRMGCPKTWNQYKDACYKGFNSKGGRNWRDANKDCQRSGASLASIRNLVENEFVFNLLPKDNDNAWIGLNDIGKKFTFAWSDSETPVTFTNWDVGQPSVVGTEDMCVRISDSTGKWRVESCSTIDNYVICKLGTSLQKIDDTTPDPSCSNIEGSTGYGAKCFFYFKEERPFDSAQMNCQLHGANLVTVNDRFVQAYITSHVSSEIWIGLANTEKATTGDNKGKYVYSWVSGADVQFTHWDRSHTGKEENTCVSFLTSPIIGLWHNSPCNESKRYICEFPREGYTTLEPVTTTPSLLPCPTHWLAIDDICYRIVNLDQMVTWMEAKSLCQGMVTKGTLASITSQGLSNRLIIEIIQGSFDSSYFWIGLSDRDAEGAYTWAGGEPFIYQNWAKDEPSNSNGREDCVDMVVTYSAIELWHDRNCYSPIKSFICQANRGAQAITTLEPPTGVTDPQCGDGTWKSYRGYCYKLHNGLFMRKSWYDARTMCHSEGSDLVSIADEEENGFVTKMVLSDTWIGLSDLDNDVYKWVDGTLYNYFAWSDNEPNDGGGGERCAEMKRHGSWNDASCQERKDYMCKKKIGNSGAITMAPATPPTGGCPVYYYGVAGTSMCYLVGGRNSSDMKTFDEARKACKDIYEKSRLASIHSVLDEEFITTLIADLKEPAWIGFNSKGQYYMNSFKWADNTQNDFLDWTASKPSFDRMESCAEMILTPKHAGQWNNVDCNTKLPYVCEYRKDKMFRNSQPSTEGCKSGYRRFKDSCYKYVSKAQSWQDSENTCVQDGGHLVWMNSRFETAFLRVLLKPTQLPMTWTGLKNSSSGFQWSNGWPIMYTPWGIDQPDLSLNCVALNDDGTWSTNDCQALLSFVCEISLSLPPTPTSTVPGKCSDNKLWTLFNGHCYHFELKQMRSWADARLSCQHLGGELASIHNDNQMTYIAIYLALEQADAWIGLHRTVSETYQWSDDAKAEYYNWGYGGPISTNETMQQACVFVQANDGKWTDKSCLSQNGFICKVAQIPLITATSSATSGTSTSTITTPGTTVPVSSAASDTSTSAITTPGTTAPPDTTQNPEDGNTDSLSTRTIPNWNTNRQRASQENSGVTSGAVAGIVIGVVAFIAIIVIVNIILWKRRSGCLFASARSSVPKDYALYSVSKSTDNIIFSETSNA